jgi:SpoIID/LytB domain protein
VTLVRSGIRLFDRVSREHALLVSCACFAILLFTFPSPPTNWIAFGWNNNNSQRDEAEIDSALQQAAVSALGDREGAIIIMDAQTGRVRALVNPEGAYQQALMPGSTMKPFTALAALRAGVIDEDSRTVCPGRFTGLSFSLACVHADHLPPFTPSQAIAYSCNYYFATLGQRLGRDRLIETARQFGFAQPTGVADDEVAGMVRPCESGNGARVRVAESNHVSEQADCAAREAVGESDHIQVTPIQLLSAYTALVNGGHLYEPRIASAGEFQAIERSRVDVANQHRAIITEGMAGAVRYGTARNAKLDSLPLTILGKTGTALPAKGFRTNGWFIGFAAPFQSNRELDPSQIDLAVLVLLSRAHGSEAAIVARPIFEAYANEIGHRGAGAQSISKQEGSDDNKNFSASPRLPVSGSPVRVHLVHDNITQELTLEDYVLGVMRAEGTMETEPEALKALAIAIRTFALKNLGRHAKDGYDFCSTTHCQRFVGRVRSPLVSKGSDDDQALPADRASDTNLIAAVRATEGQVLRDEHGQIIDSYFGASCGGETANIGSLWGVTPPEYLRGVRDEYCDAGPHAKWIDTISRADLLRALQSDSRTDVGNRLDQIIIRKRDETDRAEFITLEGEHRKTVRGWDFKIIVGRVLGWNVLKSSRFEVARSGSNFIFRGSGFGHGLGLCQEGAHVMAARGISFQRILEKYFPGTRVVKDDKIAAQPPHSAERLSLSGRRFFLFPTQGEAQPRPEISNTLERKAIGFPHWEGGKAPMSKPEQGWHADLLLASPIKPRASMVSANAPRFISISSEHFRVTYPSDVDRRDADQVLNTLESARSDFLRRASSAAISLDIPLLEIRLNESTGDFTARTGQPWWAAAATKGNRIELQPVAILKRRGVLMTTLRHELAHVVIDAISRNRAPRWLEEGFAIYLAGEGKLFSHYQTRGVLSNEELEKRLERPGSQQDMRALYAQAYISVSELIREQGEASVWKKLAAS